MKQTNNNANNAIFQLGIFFSIINDDGKSLIGNRERMNDIREQLLPIFGSRYSNFAFKCNRCKDDETKLTAPRSIGTSTNILHDNSILNNNTITISDGINAPKSLASNKDNTSKASNTSNTDSNSAESGASAENRNSAKVHSSDFNAEIGGPLYDKLLKRKINMHHDTTNQGGSNLSMPSGSLPADSS
ncbi:hypothetical protein EON73_04920, partial [bacterium]